MQSERATPKCERENERISFWMAVHVCMSELLAMCVKREKFILYEPKFFRYYALSPSFKNQEEKKSCLCMCILSFFCPGLFQHFYPIFVFSLCLTFLRTHHPFRTNHESHWKCPSYLLNICLFPRQWKLKINRILQGGFSRIENWDFSAKDSGSTGGKAWFMAFWPFSWHLWKTTL